MKRWTRIAAAVGLAAAACAGAHAQLTPTLYGVLDASAARVRPAGGVSRWQLDSGSLTTSYVGLRGSEDLGGGLRARFQLEHFLRVDTGQSGRFDGQGFWGRDSFVGLQGAFGTTVLGRNTTPFFQSTSSFNPFGESFGYSPSVRQYYARGRLGDRSWNNSVAYTNNPADGALKLSLAYNAGEGAPGSSGKNIGASVFYIAGPLALTGAVQRVRNGPLPLPAGFHKQDAWQIGAAYDLSVVRLYAQAGEIRTLAAVGSRTRLYHVGASAPLGAGVLLAAYGHGSTREGGASSKDRSWSVGYDHFLSKRTDIYAVYLHERFSGLSSGSSIAAGMRVRF